MGASGMACRRFPPGSSDSGRPAHGRHRTGSRRRRRPPGASAHRQTGDRPQKRAPMSQPQAMERPGKLRLRQRPAALIAVGGARARSSTATTHPRRAHRASPPRRRAAPATYQQTEDAHDAVWPLACCAAAGTACSAPWPPRCSAACAVYGPPGASGCIPLPSQPTRGWKPKANRSARRMDPATTAHSSSLLPSGTLSKLPQQHRQTVISEFGRRCPPRSAARP
jgi:hypothetical protein